MGAGRAATASLPIIPLLGHLLHSGVGVGVGNAPGGSPLEKWFLSLFLPDAATPTSLTQLQKSNLSSLSLFLTSPSLLLS